jgi:hypothetical protein
MKVYIHFFRKYHNFGYDQITVAAFNRDQAIIMLKNIVSDVAGWCYCDVKMIDTNNRESDYDDYYFEIDK